MAEPNGALPLPAKACEEIARICEEVKNENPEERKARLAPAKAVLEKRTLASKVTSPDQLLNISMEELERLNALHESECILLTGRIEASHDVRWVRSAKQALRILNLHKAWISRELRQRKKDAAKNENIAIIEQVKEARLAVQNEMTARQREFAENRLDRIKASNDESSRQMAVFKAVAKEVLGEEMYLHLWDIAKKRMADE